MRTLDYFRVRVQLVEPGAISTDVGAHEFASKPGADSGAPDRDAIPDSIPMLTVDGEPFLPGTAIAGSLRASVRSALEARQRTRGSTGAGDVEGQLGQWFGSLGSDRSTPDAVPGRKHGGAPDGEPGEAIGAEPSRVIVIGSRFVSPVGEGAEFLPLHRTAIDRHTGAARNRTKRFDQVLAPGTLFDICLRLDPPRDRSPKVARDVGADAGGTAAEDLTPELLGSYLMDWQPFLGSGVSRGQGKCRVIEVRHGTLDLGTVEDLHRYLSLGGWDLVEETAVNQVKPVESPLAPVVDVSRPGEVTLQVSTREPLAVGSGLKVPGEDNLLPILMRSGDPVVPGSAWKGVLRSRCEYILRSVGINACEGGTCGQCWTCQMMGHGGGERRGRTVGARSRVRTQDSKIHAAGRTIQNRTHVAIDRFTGGAEDGKLYRVQSVTGTTTLSIGLWDVCGKDRRRLLALLRLVVQDFEDGLIGIGGHVTRGYGGLHLESHDLPSLEEAHSALRDWVEETQADDAHAHGALFNGAHAGEHPASVGAADNEAEGRG